MRSAATLVKELMNYPLRAVEIGTALGTNALDMLNNLPVRMMYLVDPYTAYNYGTQEETDQQKEHYAAAFLYVRPFHGKVFMITWPSLFAAELFMEQELDFVYVDGNHVFSAVMGDLEAWWPKVRKGGVLGGHDYNTGHTGVKQAVDMFANKYGLKVESFKDSDWVIRKSACGTSCDSSYEKR